MLLYIKYAIRNLTRRRSRTALAFIGIILAVFLFISVNSTITEISNSILESYTYALGDFDLVVYQKGLTFFNMTNVTNLVNSVEDVNVTVPRLIFKGITYTESSNTLGLLLVGINTSLDKYIGSFELVSGDLDLEGNKTVVLPKIAKLLGYNVGDNITLTTYNFQKHTFVNTTITISGIAEQRGKLPKDIQNVIFLDIATLQTLLGVNNSANMLFIKINEDLLNPSDVDLTVNNMVKIGSSIQKKLGFNYVVMLVKAQVLLQLSGVINSQRVLLNIFVLVALMMAFVLVASSMLISVNERIHEVGLLRSLGFSKFQVLITFLIEAIIIGSIASILGILTSYVIGPYVIAPILLTRANLTVILPTIQLDSAIYGFLLGITISIIAGIMPAINAARITPIEALSPAVRRATRIQKAISALNPERINTSLLVGGIIVFATSSAIIVYFPVLNFYATQAMRIAFNFLNLGVILIGITIAATAALPIFIKIFSLIGYRIMEIERRLAVRNILRNRRRTDFTFFMLATSIAFILLVGTLTSTYSYTAQISIQNSLGGDIVVYAGSSTVPISLSENISTIEGVESVTTVTVPETAKVGDLIFWRQYSLNIYGINTTTFAESTYVTNDCFEGMTAREAMRALQANNRSIVISKGLADALGVNIGDEIRLEISGKDYIFNVSVIATFVPGFTFTKFSQHAASTDALVSLITFQNITNSLVVSRFIVKVSDNVDPEDISQEIISNFGDDYDIQVATTAELTEDVRESYEQTAFMFTTLLLFAVIISILGHITGLMATINERKWEIGLTRSIGMSQLQVLKIFVFESFLIAISGFLVGFFSSLVVAFELTEATNLVSEITIPLIIPYDLLLELLGLITFISIVASSLLTCLQLRKNIVILLRTGSRI